MIYRCEELSLLSENQVLYLNNKVTVPSEIVDVLSLNPEEVESLFSLPTNMLSNEDNLIALNFRNLSTDVTS